MAIQCKTSVLVALLIMVAAVFCKEVDEFNLGLFKPTSRPSLFKSNPNPPKAKPARPIIVAKPTTANSQLLKSHRINQKVDSEQLEQEPATHLPVILSSGPKGYNVPPLKTRDEAIKPMNTAMGAGYADRVQVIQHKAAKQREERAVVAVSKESAGEIGAAIASKESAGEIGTTLAPKESAGEKVSAGNESVQGKSMASVPKESVRKIPSISKEYVGKKGTASVPKKTIEENGTVSVSQDPVEDRTKISVLKETAEGKDTIAVPKETVKQKGTVLLPRIGTGERVGISIPKESGDGSSDQLKKLKETVEGRPKAIKMETFEVGISRIDDDDLMTKENPVKPTNINNGRKKLFKAKGQPQTVKFMSKEDADDEPYTQVADRKIPDDFLIGNYPIIRIAMPIPHDCLAQHFSKQADELENEGLNVRVNERPGFLVKTALSSVKKVKEYANEDRAYSDEAQKKEPPNFATKTGSECTGEVEVTDYRSKVEKIVNPPHKEDSIYFNTSK